MSSDPQQVLREKVEMPFYIMRTEKGEGGPNRHQDSHQIPLKNVKTDEITDLQVSGIFIAIGQMPDNQIFTDVVSLDDQGYIIADETCETGTPGIYAAGDCRTKGVRQLTTAAADGAVAALAAAKV